MPRHTSIRERLVHDLILDIVRLFSSLLFDLYQSEIHRLERQENPILSRRRSAATDEEQESLTDNEISRGPNRTENNHAIDGSENLAFNGPRV